MIFGTSIYQFYVITFRASANILNQFAIFWTMESLEEHHSQSLNISCSVSLQYFFFNFPINISFEIVSFWLIVNHYWEINLLKWHWYWKNILIFMIRFCHLCHVNFIFIISSHHSIINIYVGSSSYNINVWGSIYFWYG